jgi:hypothetical protein
MANLQPNVLDLHAAILVSEEILRRCVTSTQSDVLLIAVLAGVLAGGCEKAAGQIGLIRICGSICVPSDDLASVVNPERVSAKGARDIECREPPLAKHETMIPIRVPNDLAFIVDPISYCETGGEGLSSKITRKDFRTL